MSLTAFQALRSTCFHGSQWLQVRSKNTKQSVNSFAAFYVGVWSQYIPLRLASWFVDNTGWTTGTNAIFSSVTWLTSARHVQLSRAKSHVRIACLHSTTNWHFKRTTRTNTIVSSITWLTSARTCSFLVPWVTYASPVCAAYWQRRSRTQ